MVTIGTTFPCQISPRRLPAYAKRAEAAGFGQLWVVEDCFFGGGIAAGGTALAATEHITVGVGILPAAVRNAAFTAMEFATLAELHPGRLIAGIGHGVPDWIRQVGAWPASPVTLLEENLRAIRRILAGERVTMDDRYVRIRDVELVHKPEIVPPVVAGVRGPKSLAVAGRSADGTVLAEPAAPAYVHATRQQIAATGPHTVIAYALFACAEDPADALAIVRERASHALSNPETDAHVSMLPFADELRALRTSAGSREEFAAGLKDEWLRELAVVGTVDDCVRAIGELESAGADAVVVHPALDLDAHLVSAEPLLAALR
ncbi:LLM class flavin-dependent oxidoreductase [Fodinicola acaciae]|uniref:LLM class flavin-dependent oxidoreductase n=1 Tax=Fodinicola acaciae TaxID=2681555 RepID=UPI0013D166BC|nr:LLM class flavin-dependent oxidoreductase [Fodinicola acaciae]